jgi:hypothetical protein
MENRAGEYSAVLIMFTVLSCISVCLRCFVRFKFTKLAYDDLFAVCALVGDDPVKIKTLLTTVSQLSWDKLCVLFMVSTTGVLLIISKMCRWLHIKLVSRYEDFRTHHYIRLTNARHFWLARYCTW